MLYLFNLLIASLLSDTITEQSTKVYVKNDGLCYLLPNTSYHGRCFYTQKRLKFLLSGSRLVRTWMEATQLLCVLLFLVFGTSTAERKSIFLDCGSNTSILADRRTWIGDASTGNNFTLSNPGFTASVSKVDGQATLGSLYGTARIFNTTTNYTFSVMAGNYYIRLHFCPFSFGTVNAKESTFEVTANKIKLVSKYNISYEIFRKNSYLQNLGSNLTTTYIVKEYFLNISSNNIAISFVPISGSFAFVNAMEVISVPDMFFESVSKSGSNQASPLNLIDRGMETMFRFNVGGPEIQPNQDLDLWRRWEPDDIYMFTANAARVVSNSSNISYAESNISSIAPLLVYNEARIMSNNDVVDKKFNMSWKFDVDPDFDYLVRLHFCELLYDEPGQRIFRIYLNFRIAAENYDIYQRASGKNKAYHEDYIDAVPEKTNILWVQLGPDSSSSASSTDALLNGLEIFKLSRNSNLAYVYEKMAVDAGDVTRGGSRNKNIWVAVGAGVASVFTISGLCVVFFWFCFHKKKHVPTKDNPPGWRPLVLHSMLGSTTNAMAAKSVFDANGSLGNNRTGRTFTLSKIKAATNNFDESLVIGTGGFGKVYKGGIEDDVKVAIKRAHTRSSQGLAEFETEIEMLSKLRHRHLVSLIGYCDEQNEMILVYEYMGNGTLRSHLFGSDLPSLSWKQRLDACIGAARGIHYLHTGAERGIIHRDVKTTNILLDENFVAKMADFGLSKAGPALDHTHVSTAVKGSFGYLDPEYFRRQQLTEKSDVYSFGVVLFEVVCARPVINPTLPKDQINLAEWAIRWQRQRSLQTIVDPRLEGDYSLASLKKFGEIAEKCLSDEGKNRPTMGEVLWHLEYVLQLHEAYLVSGGGCSFGASEVRFRGTAPVFSEGEDICALSSSRSAPKSDEGRCSQYVAEAEQSFVNPKGR